MSTKKVRCQDKKKSKKPTRVNIFKVKNDFINDNKTDIEEKILDIVEDCGCNDKKDDKPKNDKPQKESDCGCVHQSDSSKKPVITGRYITSINPSGNARIYVREAGKPCDNRPTIVFQHGIGGSGEVFNCQQEFLASKGYHSVSLDMRGGGNSQKIGPWTQSILATDIYNVVREVQVPLPFILVGWSFGGTIVQTYYNLYPNDILKLVLVNTTVRYLIDPPDYPYGLTLERIEQQVAVIYSDFPAFATNNVSRLLPEKCCPTQMAQARLKAIEIVYQSPPDTVAGQYESFPEFDNRANLQNIQVPVQVMWGTIDPIFNIEQTTIFRQNIPNCFVVYFKNKGHSPFITDVNEFNRSLLRFINDTYDDCNICDSYVENACKS